MVLQGILAAVEGVPVSDWVARPRIHHQFLPDRIQLEPGALSPWELAGLAARGHTLDPLDRPFGNMQAIHWDKLTNTVQAASDPRGIGSAQLLEPGPAPTPSPDQAAANPSLGSQESELYSHQVPGT